MDTTQKKRRIGCEESFKGFTPVNLETIISSSKHLGRKYLPKDGFSLDVGDVFESSVSRSESTSIEESEHENEPESCVYLAIEHIKEDLTYGGFIDLNLKEAEKFDGMSSFVSSFFKDMLEKIGYGHKVGNKFFEGMKYFANEMMESISSFFGSEERVTLKIQYILSPKLLYINAYCPEDPEPTYKNNEPFTFEQLNKEGLVMSRGTRIALIAESLDGEVSPLYDFNNKQTLHDIMIKLKGAISQSSTYIVLDEKLKEEGETEERKKQSYQGKAVDTIFAFMRYFDETTQRGFFLTGEPNLCLSQVAKSVDHLCNCYQSLVCMEETEESLILGTVESPNYNAQKIKADRLRIHNETDWAIDDVREARAGLVTSAKIDERIAYNN